jgi:hypothetical protein
MMSMTGSSELGGEMHVEEGEKQASGERDERNVRSIVVECLLAAAAGLLLVLGLLQVESIWDKDWLLL